MNKLQQLIQQLCPDGVEYKPLGEYINIHTGSQFNKRDMSNEGPYPVLNGGTNPSGFAKIYNEQENTITISQGGASAGYVNWMTCKFYAGAHCYVVKPLTTNLDNKYLYYVLKNVESYLMKAQHGAGIPALNREIIKKYIIPLPPLEVQEEIARILDKFSLLSAELEAELELRKKQYDFYRNRLLSFDSNSVSNTDESSSTGSTYHKGYYPLLVKWKTLGEIGAFYGGLTGKSKSDFSNGNARFVTYMNVYKNLALDTRSNDMVRIAKYEKQNTIQYGDALFTGSSETPEECGLSSVVTTDLTEPMYLNSFCFGFRLHDQSLFYPDFLKHLLRSSAIRREITKTANGVTRYNVSKKLMEKIRIPIPAYEEQVRLATILDRFESLVNDLSKGLPAEITAVQQQYEYYRNKLLTFSRNNIA